MSIRLNNITIQGASEFVNAPDLYTAAEIAKDGVRSSDATLKRILAQNASTEYAQAHNLHRIENRSQYRQAHPLTSYEYYRPFVERMAAGETRILSSAVPKWFVITSGTTADPKLIPRIEQQHHTFSHHSAIQSLIAAKLKHPMIGSGSTACLMARPEPSQTVAGTPILPLSYLNFTSRYSSQMDVFSSPQTVFELTQLRTAIDLHLLFALRTERLTSISATFLPVLLDQFFYRMDQIGPSICEALDSGKIDAVARNLDDFQRTALNNALGGPATARAKCIESALRSPTTLVARVWPELRYVRCLSSASFAIGRSRLQGLLGSLPIFSPVLSASEALLGFSLNPENDPPQYALVTQDAFVEFLPDSATDANATLFMDEVAVGGIYHVIVTTYAGFYRYRLGDRVKVVGFWGVVPLVELLGRVGLALNAFGEKTPEESLVNAMREIAKKTGIDLHEFVATLDWSPATYVIYVGIRFLPALPKKVLSQMMDDALRHYNPDYEDFRVNGSLAESRVEFILIESFRRVTLSDADSPTTLQKKNRVIVLNEAVIASLKAAVIL